jgi:hypothetical protein
LGLAICRMTIERHGSQLSASRGAFQFARPIKPAKDDADATLQLAGLGARPQCAIAAHTLI